MSSIPRLSPRPSQVVRYNLNPNHADQLHRYEIWIRNVESNTSMKTRDPKAHQRVLTSLQARYENLKAQPANAKSQAP